MVKKMRKNRRYRQLVIFYNRKKVLLKPGDYFLFDDTPKKLVGKFVKYENSKYLATIRNREGEYYVHPTNFIKKLTRSKAPELFL